MAVLSQKNLAQLVFLEDYLSIYSRCQALKIFGISKGFEVVLFHILEFPLGSVFEPPSSSAIFDSNIDCLFLDSCS